LIKREREQLAEDLPSILAELRGALVWQDIIVNERRRPALSALGDEIESQFKADAESVSWNQGERFRLVCLL
jgi:hypothetical protein